MAQQYKCFASLQMFHLPSIYSSIILYFFCFSTCMHIFWPNDGILIFINRSIGIMQRYSYAVSIGRCLLSNYKSPNQPCKMSLREIRLSALKIKKTDENFLCFPRSANSVASVFDVKKCRKMAKNIERDRLASIDLPVGLLINS
jgi:hypothetical protein